jgi:hypothetical protein
LLGGPNYKNNIWTRGFAIAFVFAVAVFKTTNRSLEKTLNVVTFSEFLTHPHVHHTVRQFVHCVEQLNAYIAQMPCFYYSPPHTNASTKPENIPFTEAELGAHVLRMCPLPWQDQYNMNKKGMMPMDMHLLLTSLEVIERICTHEKGKPDNLEKSNKSSYKGKKGKKHPGTNPTVRVPKKVQFEKHCDLCKKHGGAHTMHMTRDCRKYEKDGTEKSSFRAAKKGGKKNYPVNGRCSLAIRV